MGLAAKVGLSVVAVGAIAAGAGGAWRAMSAQNGPANQVGQPTAQATQSGTESPAAQATPSAQGSPTAQTTTGAPAPLEFTVGGPARVPWGEPAVLTVTIKNPRAVSAEVNWLYLDNYWGQWDGVPFSWSPANVRGGAELAILAPGASFIWTATVGTRSLLMDEYTVSFRSEWEFANSVQDWDAQRAVAAHSLTIVAPVRAIEPYWEDWCRVRTDLYETKTKMDNMRDAKIQCFNGNADDDPSCPDVYLSEEYRDEEEGVWNHFREVEAVHFRFVDEDGWDTRFSDPGEYYACGCWCQYTGEPICDTIPWGTPTELPEGDGSADAQ